MSAYLPPQHGAWAFLGLPLALGAVVAPWTPFLLVLALAWVAAYPWSYAALGLIRAKRPQRFRRPFLVWLAIVVPAVVVLVLARPWLVWVGLAYMALFAINLRYAKRNDERAMVNELVFAAECSAMVVVTWSVGAGGRSLTPPQFSTVPDRAWVLMIVCFLVLVGSTLHVKSLVRERRDARFARASRVAAVASIAVSVALAAWWGWPGGAWLVVPFVAAAVRAFIVGRRPLRPGSIGLLELAGFILVALASVLAAASA